VVIATLKITSPSKAPNQEANPKEGSTIPLRNLYLSF
jgi:hypothetical protein